MPCAIGAKHSHRPADGMMATKRDPCSYASPRRLHFVHGTFSSLHIRHTPRWYTDHSLLPDTRDKIDAFCCNDVISGHLRSGGRSRDVSWWLEPLCRCARRCFECRCTHASRVPLCTAAALARLVHGCSPLDALALCRLFHAAASAGASLLHTKQLRAKSTDIGIG